jgi:hypothetical protein
MKSLIFAVSQIIATASAACAGGFNLTWGTGCWQDNPAALASFACNTEDGSATLTASFALDSDYDRFGYVKAQLDLQSDSPTLPDWWQFSNGGGCRQGALSTTASFAAAPGGCTDPWRGQTPSSTIYWQTASFPEGASGERVPLPNRARFTGYFWVNPYLPIVRGVEYYAFSVTVDHRNTVGAGACSGCETPTTIVLNQIVLSNYLLHPLTLTTPLSNGCLRWQTGGATPCGATPVRNTTWGQVKGLYR